MNLALFCNLNFTEVYINLICYSLAELCQICLFEFIRVEGGVKFMKHVKGEQKFGKLCFTWTSASKS
jgi:hypothetical protein